MKAGLVRFRVHLWLQRRSLLRQRWLLLLPRRVLGRVRGMLANPLKGFHNPALRLFQPTTSLDSCALSRKLHRGGSGRTVTARLEHVLLSHLFLPSAPTGVLSFVISESNVILLRCSSVRDFDASTSESRIWSTV